MKNIGDEVNTGAQAGLEFITYIISGTAVGWALDRWLGSLPWLLLMGFALGTACGFWRVFQIEKDLSVSDPSSLQKALKTSTKPDNSDED